MPDSSGPDRQECRLHTHDADNRIHRRDFVKAASLAVVIAADNGASASVQKSSSPVTLAIEAFDYRGVTLLESRWLRQVRNAREFYISIPNDDILQGFRAEAGLPAPGRPLGGWCQKTSATVFGQWLSGMTRLWRATGDDELREKAEVLLTEWAKTVGPDGNCRMKHYAWDKVVCGLVDMQTYGASAQAGPLLERITSWASKTFEHENMVVVPSHNTLYYGNPQEWYTLSENLYRAYQLTGNSQFRDFAEIWLYHSYWNKFANSAAPPDAHGGHAYSHVNTFSGAAMAYWVKGDPKYLAIIRNGYTYLQNTQCYATGGYGPNERLIAPDGSLGKALETRSDTFETLCGSWAGFKLSRYLMQFTGEAHYGDWIERLFYNGVGAALPIRPGGRNFYYSDYRVAGGMKVDYWDNFTCCSGTYLQNMADFHNLIYYKDLSGLYVNLYVPSEVRWDHAGQAVKLTQTTAYPEIGAATLALDLKNQTAFSLRLRVPSWSEDMSLQLNGSPLKVRCEPGQWVTVTRTWAPGDRVDVLIPLKLRTEAVDRQHPNRIAVLRGPVVLALDYNYHDPHFALPKHDEELSEWLIADSSPSEFRVRRPDGQPVRLKFRPFYEMAEDFPYLVYFDRDALPYPLW